MLKDCYEPKFQLLTNKGEQKSKKYFRDPKAFIEFSNNIENMYENIHD